MHPELEIEVVEGGGVANHALVGSGQLPLAIVNPPMTRAALTGTDPFDQPWPELRIGLANLTLNHLQFAVSRDTPLNSFGEWVNQQYPLRIPVDRDSTVDRLVFRLALDFHGALESDLERWGGAAVPAMDYYQQLELYRSGEVDALWQFMGIPSPAIQEANTWRPLKILPLSHALICDLERRGWTSADIPTDAYGSIHHPVSTVAMGTSLGFHAGVPEDVVFTIVSSICEHYQQVQQVHPAAETFHPAQARRNPGGPLHPGAERYFNSRDWAS
jgi:TRAP transporter TAXI family solute receptor